jgi:hypothetical protein
MYKIEFVSFDTKTRAGSPQSYYVGRVLEKAGKGYQLCETKSYNKKLFSHKEALHEFYTWVGRRGHLTEDLTKEAKMKHTPDCTLGHLPTSHSVT